MKSNIKYLSAKHKKSFYKNDRAWLEAVYRNNKERINLELSEVKNPKRAFIRLVQEYMESGMSGEKALKTVSRSRIFTPARDIFRENMWNEIRSDKIAYKKFRDLTRVSGRYTDFDPDKVRWDKSQHVYIYDNRVLISFRNSPKQTIVERFITDAK